jgi:hypothetical protein
LQPRGNVHAIAKEVSSANHNVADVNSNAEEYAAVGCKRRVCFGQGFLRFHRALHGFHGAPKFGEDTIARRVRYAAAVFPNEPIEDRAPFGQSSERANFVSAHEAAVAFYIRCEDCDEASADFRRV